VKKPTRPRAVARGYQISDDLWARIEPLLPPPPRHPLGCHRQRVENRRALDAIFFVLRTGCQWNALSATGICSSSAAHRRFQEWRAAGVFRQLWQLGLAVAGRGPEQSSAGWGKKAGPTRPTALSGVSSAVC
jgi:transposase